MQCIHSSITLVAPNHVSGVVVRPRKDGPPQTLFFLRDEVRELHALCDGSSTGGGSGTRSFSLSAQPLQLIQAPGLEMRYPCHMTYDPITDATYFAQGCAIMKLDSNNIENSEIRRLDVCSGEVTTVLGSAPQDNSTWTALSYDTSANVLMAATRTAVCRISLDATGRAVVEPPCLVAGDWSKAGHEDGSGTAARFWGIKAILAGAGGSLYIVEFDRLRCLVGTGYISTLHVFGTEDLSDMYTVMALLPGGELVVGSEVIHIFTCSGGGFVPCSEQLAGWGTLQSCEPARPQSTTPTMPEWLEMFAIGGDDGSGGGGGGAVKVVAADGSGRSFLVHRNALVKRSDYFKQLLQSGGGFSDSGAAVVTLLEGADPEAFHWLLSYMYDGMVRMPDHLLRPAMEIAGWLLLQADGMEQLQTRLMATVTPGSVLSDLVWAEQHSMAQLVPLLKEFVLRRRREVVAASGRQKALEWLEVLATRNPILMADLTLKLMAP
ncbi:Ankyrin repeat and BTB/POZ domain-containing protein 1 [Pleodorina starrii]|nr:Ankyrin repeat and BTB/POZ domain-containing protein 1 [Pleodorina starrii]